jgi:hypothetical protein
VTKELMTTPKQTKELKMMGCGLAFCTEGNFEAAAKEPLHTAEARASKYPDITFHLAGVLVERTEGLEDDI